MGREGNDCRAGLRTVLLAAGILVAAPAAQAVTVSTLQADGSCVSSGEGPEYRNYDGSCNNLNEGAWGSAGVALERLAPAAYADGVATVRTSVIEDTGGTGKALPSTRAVSNAVVAQSTSVPNTLGVSSMLMQWGQFLDHDLDLVPTADHADSAESMPIPIEPGDDPFGGIHASGMPFSRSVYQDGVDTSRQQVNVITAYIDGSQIYGSDAATALSLRTLDGSGKLMMTETTHGGMLHIVDGAFVSGDERAMEQVGLTAMHTLFNREHNRLAEQLAAANSDWTGEQIYQEARKINIAQMQSITFNEFLPALLGSGTPVAYAGYDDGVNPGIRNEFNTAAYRFGHSTLSSLLLRLDENGEEIAAGHLPLQQAFFNPNLLMDPANGGIEPILRGLAVQHAQEVDNLVVAAVRDMLFPPPVDLQFDLAALNMQRGRDHGLPGYNAMRAAVLGEDAAYAGWEEAVFLPGVKELLMTVYEDINDVDLWIGGLAEQHVGGGLLGELFATIVADQFAWLRDGDRFWYQNGMFEPAWMIEIERSTLSEIIMRNTTIDFLQANVFLVPAPGVLALWLIGLAAMRRRIL